MEVDSNDEKSSKKISTIKNSSRGSAYNSWIIEKLL